MLEDLRGCSLKNEGEGDKEKGTGREGGHLRKRSTGEGGYRVPRVKEIVPPAAMALWLMRIDDCFLPLMLTLFT